MSIDQVSDGLLQVIVGALLGGLISLIAFQYKGRKEKVELINTALFHLLEVWRVLGILSLLTSDKYFEKLLERIRIRFPKENVPDELALTFKKYTLLALPYLMGNRLHGEVSFSSMYEESIARLSHVLPVKAHELSGNTMVIGYLNSVDQIFSEEERAEAADSLEHVKQAVYANVLSDLEGDLKYLARKSAWLNWWSVREMTARVRSRLENIPDEPVDEFIDLVIEPMIQRHYDQRGVPNPNKDPV